MRAWGLGPPLRVGHERAAIDERAISHRCSRSIDRNRARRRRMAAMRATAARSWTFMAGTRVAGLGYGHPRWLAALSAQARQMAFQTMLCTWASERGRRARLAKFVDSGGHRVLDQQRRRGHENALKLHSKSRDAAKPWRWNRAGTAARALGAVTWGALGKWYGFPRTPFDVDFDGARQPGAGRTVRGHRHRRSHRGTGAGAWRRLRCRKADAGGPASTVATMSEPC